MKKKHLLVLGLLGALGVAGGGWALASDLSKPEMALATNSVTISNKAELLAAFNGSAEKTTYDITLGADIDMDGGWFAKGGMAGEYSGTFDGGGHKIYNASVGANNSIFNIIASSGTVKNLNLEATVQGAVIRPLSYQNNGTIQDCAVTLTTGADSTNNVAAYAYLAGSGSYTNLTTNWVVGHTSEWLCTIYRDGSSTKVSNCFYSLTGSKKDNTINFQANGAQKKTTVSAVSVANIEETVGATTAATATLTGTDFDHIKWTVEDTAIATVSSESTTTASVDVTGVSQGTTTLTAKVYQDSAETTLLATGEATITISADAPVSAIVISPSSKNLVEGSTVDLSSTLTGNQYNSISWSTSDADIATVSVNISDSKKSTVTAVGAGTATITATVKNETEEILATGTCSITVTAATKVDFYFFIQQSKSFTKESIVFYGGGITETSLDMEKLTITSKFADTSANDSPIVLWDIYYLSANFTNLGITSSTTGVYFQAGNGQSAGRWGAGHALESTKWSNGYAICLPNASAGSLLDLDTTGAVATKNALNAYSTITSSDWRISNSVCWILSGNQSKYNSKMSTYNTLDADSKNVFDSFVDYDTTMGNTFSMLAEMNPYSGSSVGFFADQNGDDSSTIVLYSAIAIIALTAAIGIGYIVKRKRA